MNQTNTPMVAIFIALGVVLVAAMVTIPVVHEANAKGTPVQNDDDNPFTGDQLMPAGNTAVIL
jgi:hypothetical protein